MNQMPLAKRIQVINSLVEGNSLRASARLSDVSFNAVLRLLVTVGTACQRFHDETVVNVKANRIQADEIWAFVYAKEKNASKTNKVHAGDVWTWTAIDSETKLMISYLAGKRDAESAGLFMDDLSRRLANRVQLTSDGFRIYPDAVEDAFEGNIDYAQLVKQYGVSTRQDGTIDKRIQYIGAERNVINGNPDRKYISTSHVERQNLTMRMGMRRFTRKTNAFSKKFENHCHAIAIHFVYYNFVRIHKSLRVTPAMEAGLTNRLMEIEDMVNLVDKYAKEDKKRLKEDEGL